MNIEARLIEYQNDEIDHSKMLMWTIALRRRLVEIDTIILNRMRAEPTADERIAAALA